MDNLLGLPIGEDRVVGDLVSAEIVLGILLNVVAAFAILFVALMISGWVRRKLIRTATNNENLDLTLFSFLANILRYAILAMAFIFILNRFGIQTTSLVAVVGAAGLAIGLAMQGALSSIAAGVMLVIFRPFKIGDFVDVAGLMGTVKDISIVATELATVDNLQIIVPNAKVWGSPITNYSTYDTRRAEWLFGVGYGADLAKAEQIIRDTVLSDPRALQEPAPFLQVNNLGDFSVDFLVRVWCNRTDLFAFQADMKRAVKEAFDANGIDIPFPTQTVIRQG